MSSRMLRSGIRSESFDLPVPCRHGKERQKLERDYSPGACPVPAVLKIHLLRRFYLALPPCMQAKRYWRQLILTER
ncbi:unnamed protein product [Spirodela intermedia]|uniref:Uncharacterized protein n=2 Tax=Spirodela intermedia TaxID=51605 RepID=A0A7I8KZY4_SPIIN|nr:unnamed protein product [Spirodela intermedia]CAA6666469.1 unnamed protein product [Spirodela intermedia]CAA7403261.1 unnamed protein product [Spirodela intermedia]